MDRHNTCYQRPSTEPGTALGTGATQAPASVSGRPVVDDRAAPLCHRGIFDVDGDLPALQHQPTITYAPLRGRIWTASEGIYRSIFLEGDKGVICFDTFSSPGAAIAYRKAIGRVLPGRPIHTVVYSHDHLDHTGYALDLAPNAEVIAHDDCAEVVRLRRSDGQKPATESWAGEQATYEIDGTRFVLLNPGSTHGNGNVAAWFPEERLLFMVDTVIPGVGYTFLPDWHLASYLPSMRRLEAIDFDLFVPGHFWCLDHNGFRDNLDFFEFILGAGEEALRDGVDPHDYRQVAAYAADRYAGSHHELFRYHEYFAMNLMRSALHALQGGWGLEDAEAPEGDSADALRAPITLPAPKPPPHAGGLGRPSAGASAVEVEVEPLAEGLWSAAHGDVRAIFAAGEAGVVTVNTFGSPEAARAYRRAIERTVPGAPIVAQVLSVDHADHAGFVSELAPGVTVVAHELCARVLAARGCPAPDRVLAGAGGALEFGGVAIELAYPGPTLGTGNLACHFVRQGALFMVGPRADARYGLFADWHIEHYAESVRLLLERPFETFVPGAGPLMDRARLQRSIAYLEGLKWACQKAFAEGIAIWDLRAMEEYATEVLRGSFGDLDGFAEHVGIAAIRVVHHYLMGGWGIEDTRAPEALLGGR